MHPTTTVRLSAGTLSPRETATTTSIIMEELFETRKICLNRGQKRKRRRKARSREVREGQADSATEDRGQDLALMGGGNFTRVRQARRSHQMATPSSSQKVYGRKSHDELCASISSQHGNLMALCLYSARTIREAPQTNSS